MHFFIVLPLTLLTRGSPTRHVSEMGRHARTHMSEWVAVCLETAGPWWGTITLRQERTWSERAMPVWSRTTLTLSAMDLWSLTLSMCEYATHTHSLQQHHNSNPQKYCMHSWCFVKNIKLKLEWCSIFIRFKFRATNIKGQHTDSEYSEHVKTTGIYIQHCITLHEKVENMTSITSLCVTLSILSPLLLSVVDGLLTREEQIILGVLLSFFLAVLLIMIICGSVK